MGLLDWGKKKVTEPESAEAAPQEKPSGGLLKPRKVPPNIQTNIPNVESRKNRYREAEDY